MSRLRQDVSFGSTFALRRSESTPGPGEATAAVTICGWLYLAGGLLCSAAALLPHVGSPAGVTAVGLDALLTSAVLLYVAGRGRGGLWLAFLGDMWGIAIIAVLCASSGGSSSPFGLIYFFAIGHGAAFQPLRRSALVFAAGTLCFVAPWIYEDHVTRNFEAIVCVGVALGLLTAAVLRSALNRMRVQRRRLEILIQATARLDKSLDPGETLRTVADIFAADLADLCVIDLLDGTGSIGSSVVAAGDTELARRVEQMREEDPLDTEGNGPVAEVLSGERPYLLTGASGRSRDLAVAGTAGTVGAAIIGDVAFKSAAVLPMVARDRVLGVISLIRLEGGARYGPGLVAVLEDLAGRASMAYDNAHLYAERAQVARTLRRSLMPAVLPSIPGLGLASYFRPMGAGSEVGGDFYDAFADRDSCWLIVGDVCGKGAEAAALTGFLRNTAAAYARDGGRPGRVLSQVNSAMIDHDFDGRFATAILAQLRTRPEGIEVTIAVAGHPPALLVRADGSVGELGGSGALLGVFPDPVIEEVVAVLAPGDGLALYTDGLAEAHAPSRLVGVPEMIERLEREAPTSPQQAIDGLLSLIDVDAGVRDDIAILAAQVQGSAALLGDDPVASEAVALGEASPGGRASG
ncbi:MAG TPA: GAF domain-containing SpoIIE family protein phosphatase [Solirubrobacteraceae bacterium]|nr:GAF domain-containing SpoIIE family protein phosphatase [Solirubrobacteraceae bacterium]